MLFTILISMIFSVNVHSACIDIPISKVELNDNYKDTGTKPVEVKYKICGGSLCTETYDSTTKRTILKAVPLSEKCVASLNSAAKGDWNGEVHCPNVNQIKDELNNLFISRFLSNAYCSQELNSKVPCKIEKLNVAKYSGIKDVNVVCSKDGDNVICSHTDGVKGTARDMIRLAVIQDENVYKIKFLDVNREFNLPLKLSFMSENNAGGGSSYGSEHYRQFSWKIDGTDFKIVQSKYTDNEVSLFDLCEYYYSGSTKVLGKSCEPTLVMAECKNSKGVSYPCVRIKNSYSVNLGNGKTTEQIKDQPFFARKDFELLTNPKEEELRELASVGVATKATAQSVNGNSCPMPKNKI